MTAERPDGVDGIRLNLHHYASLPSPDKGVGLFQTLPTPWPKYNDCPPVHAYIPRRGLPIILHTNIAQEANMNPYDEYRSYYQTPVAQALSSIFAQYGSFYGKAKSPDEIQADVRERAFAQLDVQAGDVVKLSYGNATGDTTTGDIEGTVAQVRKHSDGTVQLRFEGPLGETPHGNHRVYFPVRKFDVDVVKRSFRWTRDERALVAMVNIEEEYWEKLDEPTRERLRRSYAPKVKRIIAALDGEN